MSRVFLRKFNFAKYMSNRVHHASIIELSTWLAVSLPFNNPRLQTSSLTGHASHTIRI